MNYKFFSLALFIIIVSICYSEASTPQPGSAPLLNSYAKNDGVSATQEKGSQSEEGATSQKTTDQQQIKEKTFDNYDRNKNQNLAQTNDEKLNEKMNDNLNSARDLNTRDFEDIDQGRNQLVYQRNKNKGNQEFDKIGYRDAGLDNSGSQEQFNNQNYAKRGVVLSDTAGSGFESLESSNRNSQFQNRQNSIPSSKSHGGSYGGLDFEQQFGEAWGNKQNNKFGNQNAFGYADNSDYGNVNQGAKSNYNNKQWDKAFNKDSGKSNIDNDDLYFMNDNSYNKQRRDNTVDLKDRLAHNQGSSRDASKNSKNLQNMNDQESSRRGTDASKQSLYSNMFDSFFDNKKNAERQGYTGNSAQEGRNVQQPNEQYH
jgi:hypothetical protein